MSSTITGFRGNDRLFHFTNQYFRVSHDIMDLECAPLSWAFSFLLLPSYKMQKFTTIYLKWTIVTQVEPMFLALVNHFVFYLIATVNIRSWRFYRRGFTRFDFIFGLGMPVKDLIQGFIVIIELWRSNGFLSSSTGLWYSTSPGMLCEFLFSFFFLKMLSCISNPLNVLGCCQGWYPGCPLADFISYNCK